MPQPNILFIMTDQQRADTIAALGNGLIKTPNFDRLVRRGLAFTNAYSTCPVCVPARYTIRTGREPVNTGYYQNSRPAVPEGAPQNMEERCGPYLARTMSRLGYRTFGIGKFHTQPRDEDLGYETHLHSEETGNPPAVDAHDAYARFIATEHPEFAYLEQLHGERTEMYYMPQMSPLPAHLTVEAWAADRAVEQLNIRDERPYFGFVSFIGPHPPLAPPIPFNRMYNPDHMPDPIRGDIELDHMDEQIPFMNYGVWAEDVDAHRARACRARYYGEISYIDSCLGRILDAVEARDDADNTLICFFSDHGDHLGDHYAWQKESFFEASCHIPFLLSWPAGVLQRGLRDDLVCLTDVFAIATGAAGHTEVRDGCDVLGVISGTAAPRESLIGWFGVPGTHQFKIMVRHGAWKYIFMANGGREQLFNVADDPNELTQRIDTDVDTAANLRRIATKAVQAHPGAHAALETGVLRRLPFEARPLRRIKQFSTVNTTNNFLV